MALKRQIGLTTATFVVIAGMIGTGIFMTTGHVLGLTGSAATVLVLWTLGGCIAVCGALCFAELAAAWPEAGGEYVYLKKIFGFLPAFLTGWVSLIVAFSAPVATGSLLLVQYVNHFLTTLQGSAGVLESPWAQKFAAALVILFFGCLHITGVRKGSSVQNALTVFKILIMVFFIGLGLFALDFNNIERLTARHPEAGPSGFGSMGLALLMVMFAYSGWNGAGYIAGEIRNPERTLPRALLWGTLITTVLYLLINIVFLMAVPGRDIVNRDDVAAIAAGSLFGPTLSGFLFLGIAVILLSTVSVYLMVGPRVCYAMARDRMLFASIARLHPRYKTPWIAIMIQTALAIIYVLAGSARTLIIYMGFAINVFPVLAVIGLLYMRRRDPGLRRPYRVPLYPIVPLFYICASIIMMIAALMAWTTTSLFSIGVLLAGIPVFYLWRTISGRS